MASSLVLHHRYSDLSPHDLSGYGNFGFGRVTAAPGRDGEPEAAAFNGVDSRIFVLPSRSLNRSGGIRIQTHVRIDALGRRRTLAEGYLSFALYAETDGAIGGSILSLSEWSGIRSAPGLVALGRWMLVEFSYSDEGLMSLVVNDELVAEGYRRLGPARGIEWPFGLHVGAWPDADERVLQGAVAEVKLWRD